MGEAALTKNRIKYNRICIELTAFVAKDTLLLIGRYRGDSYACQLSYFISINMRQ